jgi:alpha-1,2-mannosyltransferase
MILRRRSVSLALSFALFAELPLLLAGYLLVESIPTMADFTVFWETGRAVLAGGGGEFAYPAPAALALAPFGLLPYTIGAAIFGLLAIAAVPVTLYVLGVRDWRCYGAAFLTSATLSVIIAGALSSILALGAAVAWRYRAHVKSTALVVAATVVAKIFLWPLLVWLLATRRLRTAFAAAGVLAVGALAGWAVTGFSSLLHYPSQLSRMASLEQGEGYSAVAAGMALGFEPEHARVAAVVLTAVLLVAMFVVARREDGDQRSFTLAIATSLAATPIVWLHYFVLLLVPIALARPRLSGLWLLPIGFWACSIRSGGDPAMITIGVVLTVLIFWLSLRPRGLPTRLPAPRWLRPDAASS